MVSVIIPAYNAEQYLPDAIESVISQSTDDWELLVIDNGSTDRTTAIVKNYTEKDKRIHLLTKPDGGVSGARNYGIESAHGEFITFLDADDLLHPEFLTILLSVISHTGADLAGAPFISFSGKFPSSFSTVNRKPASVGNQRRGGTATDVRHVVLSGAEMIPYLLHQTPPAGSKAVFDTSVWGKIYRRDLWKNLRMRENSKFEDLDIIYRVLEISRKVAIVEKPLLSYRIHSASFIHSFTRSRLDVLTVCDRMVRHFDNAAGVPNVADCRRAAHTRRFAAACNTLILLSRRGEEYEEARGACRKIIKEERTRVLTDRKARAKDRLGALLSHFSPRLLTLLGSIRRIR